MRAITVIGLALLIAAQVKIAERFEYAAQIIDHPSETTYAWQDIRSAWN